MSGELLGWVGIAWIAAGALGATLVLSPRNVREVDRSERKPPSNSIIALVFLGIVLKGPCWMVKLGMIAMKGKME
jgi:hypothetical protein